MAKVVKPETPADVLIVDDVAGHLEVMIEGLRRAGHRCDGAGNGNDAISKLAEKRYDVVVTDLVLGGDTDGMAVLRGALRSAPDTQVILISAHGDIPTAVEAVKQGAFHFIEKPIDIDLMRTMVRRAAATVQLKRENADLKTRVAELAGNEGIIGDSAAMQAVLELVRQVAPTNIPVLITGPNGAGKELVARAIHRNSGRAVKRYVAINCAGIPESLLEDELFGHMKGVFTDAKADREGCFEYADGGTLFLDEIGDMPVLMQAKLLRALESGEVKRLGSNEPIRVDTRIISATNQDLESAIDDEKFRQDLYYRLAGVVIRVPGLIERREDIPKLAAAFAVEFARAHKKPLREITPEALSALTAYDWPGNVRQLRHVVQLMVVLAKGDVLGIADLPAEILARAVPALPVGSMSSPMDTAAGRSLRDIEREAIRRTLEETAGNRGKAAKMLGMGERTLYRKLKEYGLA